MNFCDGLVSESTRMFHVASAASKRPCWRPAGGSGFGAEAALLGLALVVALVDTERAHAVTAMSAVAPAKSFDGTLFTGISSVGGTATRLSPRRGRGRRSAAFSLCSHRSSWTRRYRVTSPV